MGPSCHSIYNPPMEAIPVTVVSNGCITPLISPFFKDIWKGSHNFIKGTKSNHGYFLHLLNGMNRVYAYSHLADIQSRVGVYDCHIFVTGHLCAYEIRATAMCHEKSCKRFGDGDVGDLALNFISIRKYQISNKLLYSFTQATSGHMFIKRKQPATTASTTQNSPGS